MYNSCFNDIATAFLNGLCTRFVFGSGTRQVVEVLLALYEMLIEWKVHLGTMCLPCLNYRGSHQSLYQSRGPLFELSSSCLYL